MMTEARQRSARAFDQPFAKAFPLLKDAVVEYAMSSRDLVGTSTSHGRLTMSVIERTFQGRIQCHHPECHGGGFEIQRIVGEMVQERRETQEGVLICPGWIAERDRVPCVNNMSYTVVLFYKVRTTPKAPLD